MCVCSQSNLSEGMTCLNTHYRPICWVMTLVTTTNHSSNELTKHQSQQRDRDKGDSNNRGTRCLCRQSALTKKDPCKALCCHRCSHTQTHTGEIIQTNGGALISQASTETVVMSLAYLTPTETIQTSKPHTCII